MNKTNKKTKSVVAENLIHSRIKLGLTAEKFAEYLGIPYPTLRDIEAGLSNGSPATLKIIAEKLKTTPDALRIPHELHKKIHEPSPDAALAVLNRHIMLLEGDNLELQKKIIELTSSPFLQAYAKAKPDIQKKVRQMLGLESRDSTELFQSSPKPLKK